MAYDDDGRLPGVAHALLGPKAQVRLTVTTRNIDEPDV